MSDVHRLGDVGTAIVDDHGHRLARNVVAEVIVVGAHVGPLDEGLVGDADVDETRPGDIC